jgi:hypothetical protein
MSGDFKGIRVNFCEKKSQMISNSKGIHWVRKSSEVNGKYRSVRFECVWKKLECFKVVSYIETESLFLCLSFLVVGFFLSRQPKKIRLPA